MTIVIAWKSTRVSGVKGLADVFLAAAVWLNDGTEQDRKNAESYAAMEQAKDDGTFEHRVFSYYNEGDPLARAKADMMLGAN